MSDEFENSLHDKIVLAFIRYCNETEKFEHFGFSSSEVLARAALLELHKLSKDRRAELRSQRIAKHGDKSKGIAPTNPTVRRQRKLNRAIHKVQADKDNNTN